MKGRTDKMNYKIVELNNKSRKGLYIYLKEPKQPGKYYKIQPGTPIEQTIKHYTTPKTKRPKRTWHKRKSIEGQLSKAIKTASTNDLTTKGIHTLKSRLFQNIVRDKQLKEIIIKDHNLQKIKHRFDITITTKGKDGTIFTAEKLNITPDQARQHANEINIGENTQKSYQSIQKLKNKGWTINQQQKGTITNITLTITFRKA